MLHPEDPTASRPHEMNMPEPADPIEQLRRLLGETDVAPELAVELLRASVMPPPDTFDPGERSGAGPARQVLLSAIVAAADLRRFGPALGPLLTFVDARQGELDDFDAGRFWHLRGYAAWRLDDDGPAATRALNRSVRLLRALDTPQARAYLARVHDTSGQLLHHRGLLGDARAEYEVAFARRQEAGDETGLAITLGNLGRLCMDLGDWEAATHYLTEDLGLVERRMPERTRLRAQLHGHLGTCALERGELAAAEGHFDASLALAPTEGDAVGRAFTEIGRGRLHLRQGDLEAARRAGKRAEGHLGQEGVPPGFREELGLRVRELEAETALASGAAAQAAEHFRLACAGLTQPEDQANNGGLRAQVHSVSPVDRARVLFGLARALTVLDAGQEAALRLREALHALDATAADSLRAQIEDELRRRFPESWLLHAAGRFIGQGEIAFLLAEAGRGGFRGARQEVVVLFADIRGFTTLAERLEPEPLVAVLNDFLGCMTHCIDGLGGLVDKFIGDAVMAVFSLPAPHADDAERALRAALWMRDELDRSNRRLAPGLPQLDIGIGLHSGPVVAGLIGSPRKRSYTVIGDVVNTASRLEGLTRQLGASILVSEDLVARLGRRERFLLRPLGRYQPKGRHTPVALFDVMGERDASPWSRALEAEIVSVEAALVAFGQRDFAAAAAAFDGLLAALGPASRTLGYRLIADQARELARHPPPADWRGAIAMHSK
jgi:class 3 adenylate cyclase